MSAIRHAIWELKNHAESQQSEVKSVEEDYSHENSSDDTSEHSFCCIKKIFLGGHFEDKEFESISLSVHFFTGFFFFCFIYFLHSTFVKGFHLALLQPCFYL